MTDASRVYYVDHDGFTQSWPANEATEFVSPEFSVEMTDGTTRTYARAGQIGGVDEVTYEVHPSGAVQISWAQGLTSEWLAPGTWRLIHTRPLRSGQQTGQPTPG